MNKYQVFEVMAIMLPTTQELDKGKDKPAVILTPTVIVSKSAQTACMKCLSNPEFKDKDLERIEFLVRPFISPSIPSFNQQMQSLYNAEANKMSTPASIREMIDKPKIMFDHDFNNKDIKWGIFTASEIKLEADSHG